MKYLQKLIISVAVFAMFVVGPVGTSAQTVEPNRPDVTEDVVLQWQRVLTTIVRTSGAHPGTILPSRSFSMMHAAMFDAINSIEGTYTPYLTDVPTTRYLSTRVAAAKAAYDVLVALYPTQQATLDTEFAISVTGLRQDRAALQVGATTAAVILANRTNDGWSVATPPYSLPTTPGNWQPLPPATNTTTFTNIGSVRPFTTQSSTQFRPAPPPLLTSAEYAADLNEAKEIGSATSTTRTVDQTTVARIWANAANALYIWFDIAKTQSIARGNSSLENARLFAMMSFVHHDALQASFASKFYYGLWRPITAIRRADEDGNPGTSPDTAWTSLIVAPPYPTYAGNAATQGMTHATILGLFFGRDDIPLEYTFEGPPVVKRTYRGFNEMANEQARSRVYGGIHFTFDSKAGQAIGRNIANYVFANYMKVRECNV